MQWDWTIKVTDLAIVVATILGPILAVQAQTWLERRRALEARRMAVFQTLMRTRATPLDGSHINALNAVPLEFPKSDSSTDKVYRAWKAYMDHVSKDAAAPSWNEMRVVYQVALLREMAAVLHYEFDEVELRTGVYSPIAQGRALAEQETIREGLAAVLRGEKRLPMSVEMLQNDAAVAARWARILEKVEAELDARRPGASASPTPQGPTGSA